MLALMAQGQYVRVINQLEQLLREADSDSLRVEAYNQLSQAYYYIDLNRAKGYLQKAETLADSLGNAHGLGVAQSTQALIFYAEGQYERGIEASIRAIQLAKGANDSSLLAQAYTHLGLAYSAKGYLSKALEYNIKALEVARSLDQPEQLARCYRYIGLSYFNLSDYEQALWYFNRAIADFEASNEQLPLASVYVDVGRIYLEEKGLLKEARAAIDKGLKLSQKLGSKRGIAYANGAMTEVFVHADSLDKATESQQKALALYRKIGDKLGQVRSLQGLARVYIRQEQFKRAVMNLERALIMAKMARAKVLAKALYLDLSDAYAAQRNYREALIAYRKYSIIKDSIFSRDKSRQLAEIQTQYETEKLAREKLELAEKNRQQAYDLEMQQKEQQLTNSRNYAIILTLLFAIVLVLVVGVLMLRQNRLKAQVREAALEQRALHAQMNPHFMFNSLNSIQSLIATGDNASASIYLARFSRLMRTILQHSRQTFVPIEKEINFISNYIELEKRRFKEAFEVQIDAEALDDTHFTMIPTFVIQPFIENAIVHGLLRKSEKGRLEVIFEPYNKHFLKCTIRDNGIGRAKASEYRSEKKNHESLGIKITQQRLEYLSMKQEVDAPLMQIIDLKDQNGKASGTQVELLLPKKLKES